METSGDPRDKIILVAGSILVLLLAILFNNLLTSVQRNDGGSHEFHVTDWDGSYNGYLTTVTGHARNDTGETIQRAMITYRIYDGTHSVVDTATDYVNTPIFPGQSWAFKAVALRSPQGGGTAGFSSLTYD